MEGSIVQKSKAKLVLVLVIGLLSLFLLLMISWSMGAVDIDFSTVINSMISIITNFGPAEGDASQQIVWSRMVRSVAVMGVGIGLSVSGVVMQALIRNPLVDPYITGVSSGAALGAILSILAGISIVSLAEFTTPVAALIGALVAFFITMTLAESAGGRSVNFVLSGMIIGIAISSITTVLIVSSDDNRLHGALFWLYGSFAYMSWTKALIIIVPILILSMVFLLYAREFNVILLGDEHAKHLGLDVRLFKRITILVVSVLTAISVAFSGIIGFLGLIVPHTSRMLVGGDHRLLIPTSMILGANVLLAADIFSRLAVRPNELPIGAVISLIGAPFFVYLMIKRGKEYGG
ncbi:MAG: iron ABC transporter permease [Methanomassiliicoccus sp.]|jgi:iron complex transport system permease protein|nr:iron ABC transporter permease [Methanomassiliicoccus sp.]